MKQWGFKFGFIFLIVLSLAFSTIAAGPLNISNPNLQVKPGLKIQHPVLAELTALCEVNGQMIGAGPQRVALLDEKGQTTKNIPIPVAQIGGIAPHGANMVIGDCGRNNILMLDLKTGQTSQLLSMNSVGTQGIIAASAIQNGKLSGIASDGQNIYAAYSAGYSSSIFKINLAQKRVVDHSWSPGDQPQALAFQNNVLYILETGNNQIRRMDAALKLDPSAIIKVPSAGAKGLIIRDNEIKVLVPAERSIINVANSFRTTPLSRTIIIDPKLIRIIAAELKPQKYAVLICGDRAESGYNEFWNDTVWMYKTLIAAGYTKEHIYVLYGNGTDYASANPFYRYSETVTDFPATITWVNKVFDGLKNGDDASGIAKLKDNDSLFVWTFDHGASSGGVSYLCLMDGWMSSADFGTRLNGAAYEKRAVFMQQCYSGGFISILKNAKTFVSTACTASQTAHRADTEYEVLSGITYYHGEYNYHIITALSGHNPGAAVINASTDANPLISALEAHNWDVTHNSKTMDTPQKDDSGGIGTLFYIK